MDGKDRVLRRTRFLSVWQATLPGQIDSRDYCWCAGVLIGGLTVDARHIGQSEKSYSIDLLWTGVPYLIANIIRSYSTTCSPLVAVGR